MQIDKINVEEKNFKKNKKRRKIPHLFKWEFVQLLSLSFTKTEI